MSPKQVTLGASILGLFLKNWFIISYLLHNKIFFNSSKFGHHTFVWQLYCWELIVMNSCIRHWHETGSSLFISHWLLRFVLASLMEVWIEFWSIEFDWKRSFGLSFFQASHPLRRRDSSSTSSIKDSRVIRRSWSKLLVNPSSRTTVVIG